MWCVWAMTGVLLSTPGGFGTCYKVRDEIDGQVYCLKEIPFNSVQEVNVLS